jgi:hypothetical protein
LVGSWHTKNAIPFLPPFYVQPNFFYVFNQIKHEHHPLLVSSFPNKPDFFFAVSTSAVPQCRKWADWHSTANGTLHELVRNYFWAVKLTHYSAIFACPWSFCLSAANKWK